MCGRYGQSEAMSVYLKALAPMREIIGAVSEEPIARFNIAPTAHVQVLRESDHGIEVDQLRWGWRPFWARHKPGPLTINARGETAMSKSTFKPIRSNRILVPANFWYEWVVSDDPSEKGKQPYLIRLKSQEPLFFAGLAQAEGNDEDGFVIVTSASDAGMVDIHDRRPVVFAPGEACQWLDSALDDLHADELVHHHGRRVDEFEWYPVSKAVGNVRNQGVDLIRSVAEG